MKMRKRSGKGERLERLERLEPSKAVELLELTAAILTFELLNLEL
jgi:hypothetical protein